jgi:hypothetical protein
MAVRYGHDRQAVVRYGFPVTQEQLGEAAALTGVHVNRSLKTLRDEGLVSLDRGTVTIHDWNRLAKVGEFDPVYLTGDANAQRQRRLLQE